MYLLQRENNMAETVMIERLLNDDLKETIAKEKKQILEDPGRVFCLCYSISLVILVNAIHSSNETP